MKLLKLGTVCLDGTKIHANASRHSALSHGHIVKLQAQLKLRRQQGQAGQVLVFVHTSAFRQNDQQYLNTQTLALRRPTSDTSAITATAVQALQAIYRPGYKFAKAGVMLLDIQSADVEQAELNLDADTPQREGLMGAMDSLNERYGQGSVALASAGLRGDARAWMMKQSFKTPGYTPHWPDIPVAKAC